MPRKVRKGDPRFHVINKKTGKKVKTFGLAESATKMVKKNPKKYKFGFSVAK